MAPPARGSGLAHRDAGGPEISGGGAMCITMLTHWYTYEGSQEKILSVKVPDALDAELAAPAQRRGISPER